MTIKDEVINGLQKMAENDLNISLDEDDQVAFCFGGPRSATLLRVAMYVVGDLASHVMILGKKGMSRNWCHLCKLLHAGFRDLTKVGTPWEYVCMCVMFAELP